MKILIPLILFSSLSFGATYYVRIGGSDLNSGLDQTSNAWASISKANNTLGAGDIVNILPGEYTDAVAPINNGSVGSYITYKAYDPTHRPIIRPSTGRSVQLTNKSYVWVQDIGLPRGVEIDAGDHHVFYKDSVALESSAKGEYGCIKITNRTNGTTSRFHTIRRCLLNHNDGSDAVYGTGCGVSITANGTGTAVNDCLIDSCPSMNCSDAGFTQAGWQTFQRNVFRADTSLFCHTGFLIEDGVSSLTTLVDHCIIVQFGVNSRGRNETTKNNNGRSMELLGNNHLIVRYCISVNDTGVTQTHDADWYHDEVNINPDYQTGVSSDAMDYYIYNNTFWGRNSNSESQNIFSVGVTPTGCSYGKTTSNINIKNNIISRPSVARAIVEENYADKNYTAITNNWTNNILWRSVGTGADDIYSQTGACAASTFIDTYTVSQLDGNFSRWDGNISSYPQFVDTTSRGRWINLNLQSNSPAIDAAAPLTYTNGAGSGTSLTVDDAKWFWAGNELVLGDSISFGAEKRRIVSRSGNVLTLDRSASWSNDVAVYYYNSSHWVGTLPDIGAYEYGSSVYVPPVSPGTRKLIFIRRSGWK
jgi:hypothetical protein